MSAHLCCAPEKGFRKMRMNELTRYLDKYVGFDAIGERIDALQDRLGKLRDNLPDAPIRKLREQLPSYRDVRSRLPYAPRRRGYALPAALVLGGVAAIGLIAVGSLVVRRQLADAQYPEMPEHKPYVGDAG